MTLFFIISSRLLCVIQAIASARSIIYQLSSYLQDSKLFFDHQYGFQPKHSTEYAALELIDRIITQWIRMKYP